jgi:hypothetical protein
MIKLNDLIIKIAQYRNEPLRIAIMEKDVEKILYLLDTSHVAEINDPMTINENIDVEKLHHGIMN